MPDTESSSVLRILDANANRAGEGLRVVEEYLRLALDDAHLTGVCKQLRHDLAGALAQIPANQRHAARETQQDVGTQISTLQELSRTDLGSVVAANLQRSQQSLRSLEEYSKVASPAVAARFESLRYRLYTLEKAIGVTRDGLQRLEDSRLYVLIDGGESMEEFSRRASELIAAGVHLLQLRDKRAGDRRLIERARKLRELTSGSKTLFIMNDRPDLAALARADGVHVGQEELSVKDARSIVGPQALIGVSTHSLEQARQAVLDGASYIGVGPTFPSATKTFDSHTGLELLRAVAAEIRLPAFAIGGISRENLADVLATGIERVAVASAVAIATSLRTAAEEMLSMLSDNRVVGG
jgi:thiamine-phosphate pyrophosphorylase